MAAEELITFTECNRVNKLKNNINIMEADREKYSWEDIEAE